MNCKVISVRYRSDINIIGLSRSGISRYFEFSRYLKVVTNKVIDHMSCKIVYVRYGQGINMIRLSRSEISEYFEFPRYFKGSWVDFRYFACLKYVKMVFLEIFVLLGKNYPTLLEIFHKAERNNVYCILSHYR